MYVTLLFWRQCSRRRLSHRRAKLRGLNEACHVAFRCLLESDIGGGIAWEFRICGDGGIGYVADISI